MAFQRNHVSSAERIEIGLKVFQYKSRYGLITDLARKYVVSRWFIYYCYLNFTLLLDVQNEKQPSLKPRDGYYAYDSLDARVLSLYLDTEASVNGVRKALKNLFGQEVSIGRISEMLNDYGNLLESSDTVTCRVKFISDEIFIGVPVLVTVEPVSGYILSLERVAHRDKETWGACWIELIDSETGQIERIIADLGTGLLGGIELLCEDSEQAKVSFQGDMFHILMRLVAGINQAERKAYAAIEQEFEAFDTFERAKSERVLQQRLEAYETARAEASAWIQCYDESLYLFRELQAVLQIVDMNRGELRHKADVIAEVEAILELLEHDIGSEKIQKGAEYIRKHQEALLQYFDEVEAAAEELNQAIVDSDVRQCVLRLYAYQQQLYTAYGQRKRFLHAQKAALEQRLAERLGEAEDRRVYQLVEQKLSSILRSSSMVENTNSRLRRFFDSARNQVNQARLNLIRFYLNHKRFERGRRRGKTASQLFYGDEASSEHWLSMLLAKKAQNAATA